MTTFNVGTQITTDSTLTASANVYNATAISHLVANSTFSASAYVVNRIPQAVKAKQRPPKEPFVPRIHNQIKPPRRKGP